MDRTDPDRIIMVHNGVYGEKIPVSRRDFECLAPNLHITDTIISVWLSYVQKLHKIMFEREHIFIFPPAFFDHLRAPLNNNMEPGSAAICRYQRVSHFTEDVNVIDKDYLIIPIKSNNYWSLAIVGFPNGQVRHNYGEYHGFVRHPFIIYFDPIDQGKDEAREVFQLLRNYLVHEFEAAKQWTGQSGKLSLSRFSDLYPRVLNSTSEFDTGLLILQYAESFLKDPIKRAKIEEKTHHSLTHDLDLSKWFSRKLITDKRREIYEFLGNFTMAHFEGNKSYIPSMYSICYSLEELEILKQKIASTTNKETLPTIQPENKEEDLCNVSFDDDDSGDEMLAAIPIEVFKSSEVLQQERQIQQQHESSQTEATLPSHEQPGTSSTTKVMNESDEGPICPGVFVMDPGSKKLKAPVKKGRGKKTAVDIGQMSLNTFVSHQMIIRRQRDKSLFNPNNNDVLPKLFLYYDEGTPFMVKHFTEKARKSGFPNITFIINFDDKRITHFIPQFHLTTGLRITRLLCYAILKDIPIINKSWMESLFSAKVLQSPEDHTLDTIKVKNLLSSFRGFKENVLQGHTFIYLDIFSLDGHTLSAEEITSMIGLAKGSVASKSWKELQDSFGKVTKPSELRNQNTHILATHITYLQDICDEIFDELMIVTLHPRFIEECIWSGSCDITSDYAKACMFTNKNRVEAKC